MKALFLRFAIALLTFLIGLVLTKLAATFGLDYGNTKKVWASPNNAFEVRLISNLELGEYRFQSTTNDSNKWRDFFILRLDDYALIPDQKVEFANDRIGYVSIAGILAVTTDGGEIWTVWDADKQLPKRNKYDHKIIDWVQIRSDGTGEIAFDEGRGLYQYLYTEDYGRHWFRKLERIICALPYRAAE